MDEPKCICWMKGYPRGDRHQSECDSYGEGWDAALAEARADALDVDRLREAARRVPLPREVTVADIENLAREYSEFSMSTRDLARLRRGADPGEEADPSFASAPGPLDPAAEGYVVVVDRSLPCPLDPKCYRYQGHDGEHMYAEPPAQQLNHAISESIAKTPPKKKKK